MPTLIMSASAMLAPAVHRHCSFIDSREVNNFLSSYGNDNTKDKVRLESSCISFDLEANIQ